MTEDTATFVIAPGDQVWVPVNEDTECYRSVRVKVSIDYIYIKDFFIL